MSMEETQNQNAGQMENGAKIEPVIRKDRQLKYTGNILKIYEDTVIANGHEAHWDYIHHDGAAAVVAVADDGKLLMVRQYRNALDRETLEIPAGKLDAPDEPKIECAYRELEEETGYRCEKLEYLMSLNTTVAFCDEAIDVFVARNLIPSHQHLDEDEVIHVERWSIEDLQKLIYTGKNDRCQDCCRHYGLRRKIRKVKRYMEKQNRGTVCLHRIEKTVEPVYENGTFVICPGSSSSGRMADRGTFV